MGGVINLNQIKSKFEQNKCYVLTDKPYLSHKKKLRFFFVVITLMDSP